MIKDDKTEVKKNNYSLTLIILIVFVLGLGAGYIVAKKDVLKTIKETKVEEKKEKEEPEKKEENTKEENKEEKKEEQKEESKKENKEESSEKATDAHSTCSICSVSGDVCCGAGPGVTYDHLHLNVKKQDMEEIDPDNFTMETFSLHNNKYQYEIDYKIKDGLHIVSIDGKQLYRKSLIVEDVFLLDNGMVGIQYYDETDQTLYRKRDYFTQKLNLIKTIEGIKKNVDVFAKEYEYLEVGNCVKNEYKELNIYKATINDNYVSTRLVRVDKEDGCAGMV